MPVGTEDFLIIKAFKRMRLRPLIISVFRTEVII